MSFARPCTDRGSAVGVGAAKATPAASTTRRGPVTRTARSYRPRDGRALRGASGPVPGPEAATSSATLEESLPGAGGGLPRLLEALARVEALEVGVGQVPERVQQLARELARRLV